MKTLVAILLAGVLTSVVDAAVAVRFTYTGAEVANHPGLKLTFKISETGVISLDASTRSRKPEAIAAVDAWDKENIGAVEDKALFGKSFTLTALAENENGPGFPPIALWNDDGGVLGVGGQNARRIDGQVVKVGRNLERMIWTLEGDVVLHILNFACASGVHNGGIILESPVREMRTGPMGNNKTANWNIPAGAVTIAGGQQLIFKADPDLKNGAGLAGFVFEVASPE